MPFPDDVPTLTDGVVTLRAHRADDLGRVIEQCNDPETVRWTTTPFPYGAAEARDFLETRVVESWETGSAWPFAIEYAGQFAGSVDLRPRGAGGEAEVGFGLHPDARDHGVMRRAVTLLLAWAVAERDVVVVHWRCDVGNWASRRAAWRLGFRFGPTIPGPTGRPDRWTAWWGRGDAHFPTTAWLEPTVLERDGVRLRPWDDADGPALVECANDPLRREWIPLSPLPTRVEDVAAYLTRVRLSASTGDRVAWCVADAETDRVLGNVAVFDLDGGSAEVGFWSHPAGRGRGAMTTALDLVTEHALTMAGLGLRRLDLVTAETNAAARALAERCGYRLVGITHGTSTRPGDGGDGWGDSAVYETTAARRA